MTRERTMAAGVRAASASTTRLVQIPVLVEVLSRRKVDMLHWHDYCQLWYVLRGSMEHEIDGETLMQDAGTAVIVLPYISHSINSTVSDGAPEVVCVSFRDSFLTDSGYRFFSCFNSRARFEEHILRSVCRLTGSAREEGDRLIRRMLAEFSKQQKMAFDKLAAMLYGFLKLLCQNSENAEDRGFVCIK